MPVRIIKVAIASINIRQLRVLSAEGIGLPVQMPLSIINLGQYVYRKKLFFLLSGSSHLAHKVGSSCFDDLLHLI